MAYVFQNLNLKITQNKFSLIQQQKSFVQNREQSIIIINSLLKIIFLKFDFLNRNSIMMCQFQN